jgi:hypothetical protein
MTIPSVVLARMPITKSMWLRKPSWITGPILSAENLRTSGARMSRTLGRRKSCSRHMGPFLVTTLDCDRYIERRWQRVNPSVRIAIREAPVQTVRALANGRPISCVQPMAFTSWPSMLARVA